MSDKSLIPKGGYCYTFDELQSEENNWRRKIKLCPYYEVKKVNGVEFPWCNYLNLGGTPGDGKWDGWEEGKDPIGILENHFGGKKEMEEKLPLFLLFDQCKECGENDEEDYEEA